MGVHDQALPLLHEPDDGIAWYWIAAPGELHRESLRTVDHDRSGRDPGLGLAALGECEELPRDDRGEALAQADVREHFLTRFRAEVAHQALPAVRGRLG